MPDLPPTLRWEGALPGRLFLLDQTRLPAEETEIAIGSPEELADAIRRLAVRGAPAIGIAGAYGLVLAAQALPPGLAKEEYDRRVRAARDFLAATRPTAVNLAWALDRLLDALADAPPDPAARTRRLLDEALAIHEEDRRSCLAMARHAAALLADGGRYLTHCNAGSLATGGIGTAVGAFHLAAREGRKIRVYVDETRPLLQGARLTAWELDRSGVPHVLICDSAAAGLILRGEIDAAFVGADRIAANGDVANKLGTLAVALAAHRRGIPFYVVAPVSTFDPDCPDGASIPIEERAAEEVTDGFGRRTAPAGTEVRNPAFDVTPAELVTALVTDHGLVRPVDRENVAALLSRSRPAARPD